MSVTVGADELCMMCTLPICQNDQVMLVIDDDDLTWCVHIRCVPKFFLFNEDLDEVELPQPRPARRQRRWGPV